MRLAFPRLLVFVWLMLALCACNSGTYDLGFHPPHQTRYDLSWKTEGEVVFGLLGQKIRTRMNNDILSLVQFDTLPNGKTQVSFSYRQYNMSQKVNGQEVQLNPERNEDSIARSFLGSLMAIQFKAVANEQGKLSSQTSGDSVWNALESALQQLPADEKARIGAPLKSLLNDDMFVGLMEQCFYIFPSHKVDIGDTWRNQIRMRSVFSMNMHNTFELVSVNDGVAQIRLKSKVTNADRPGAAPGLAMASSPLRGEPPVNTGINLLGMTLDAKFDGTQEGEFFVDIATGLMRTGYIKQNLQGIVKFNNMEFPMALNLNNSYTLRKQ